MSLSDASSRVWRLVVISDSRPRRCCTAAIVPHSILRTAYILLSAILQCYPLSGVPACWIRFDRRLMVLLLPGPSSSAPPEAHTPSLQPRSQSSLLHIRPRQQRSRIASSRRCALPAQPQRHPRCFFDRRTAASALLHPTRHSFLRFCYFPSPTFGPQVLWSVVPG